jgi:hypothetical protein
MTLNATEYGYMIHGETRLPIIISCGTGDREYRQYGPGIDRILKFESIWNSKLRIKDSEKEGRKLTCIYHPIPTLMVSLFMST